MGLNEFNTPAVNHKSIHTVVAILGSKPQSMGVFPPAVEASG